MAAFFALAGCGEDEKPGGNGNAGKAEPVVPRTSVVSVGEARVGEVLPSVEEVGEMETAGLLEGLLGKDPVAGEALEAAAEWKNGVMNELRSRTEEGEDGETRRRGDGEIVRGGGLGVVELGEVFAGLFRDGGRPEVMRDYAAQHLMALGEDYGKAEFGKRNSEKAEGKAAEEEEALMGLVLGVMREGVYEVGAGEGSVGATVLLGYGRLAVLGKLPEGELGFARERVAATLAGAGTNEMARVSALLVGAELDPEETLPHALEAAWEGETMPIRVSATGALATIGGEEAKALLRKLTEEAETPLQQMAARRALRRLGN